MSKKLAFIVPTYNRTKELTDLLESIKQQSVYPQEIIIIDASENSTSFLINDFKELNIKYIKTKNPSLTKQKNIGARNVSAEIDIVGFLDDDIIFCDGAIDNMLSFWSNAPKSIGGASFNIVNAPRPKLILIKKLFFLESFKKGELLKSGFGACLYPVTANRKVHWLSGGDTIWKKELLNKFKFDENLNGYGFLEDLDFSYRVGKDYELFVLAKAKVKHFCSPSLEKEKTFQFGFTEITNRYYFLNKHKEFSNILFYWASLGLIIIGLIFSIIYLRPSRLKRTYGNIIGVCYTLVFKRKLLSNYRYVSLKD